MTSVLPAYTYSLASIESILFAGFQPKLLPSVIQMINNLNDELQIPEEPTAAMQSVPSGKREVPLRNKIHANGSGRRDHHGRDHHHPNGKSRGGKHHAEVSTEEWDAMLAASSVIKQKDKEGLEKDLTSIRTLMNKISTKNYETQQVVITAAIEKYMQDSNGEEDDVAKLFKSMMDIVGTNKFFSELYANLFKVWFIAFPAFLPMWEKHRNTVMHSIDDICYIDPNTDYDGYCNYTKINDKRKAYTTFIGNLCKKGAISQESVCEILEYYLQKTLEYMDVDGRTTEVEEITENVHILTQLVHSTMSENGVWNETISPILIRISQMKMREHASLSNRAVFKYMDIIENL